MSNVTENRKLLVQAVSECLVVLPRQHSGDVIALDSEGGSQDSQLHAEDANGTDESIVSSLSSRNSRKLLRWCGITNMTTPSISN